MSSEINRGEILKSTLGAELDDAEASLLASKMKSQHLADGEAFVIEGEPNDKLCLLVSGLLAVANREGDRERVVYRMHPGECAGTRAFMDAALPKATLRSIGESTVYTLTPGDFEPLVEAYPRLGYRLMRSLFRIVHDNLVRTNMESEQLSHYITRTHGRY